MNRKNLIIIISILAFILIIGGVSYSYFVYNKDIGTVSLTAGDISIDLSGVNGNQTLSNVVPLSDFDGKNSSSYFDFTVNSTVDTERIYYEVYIMPDSNNTLDTSYLKTYLTDQNNNEIKGITIYNDLGVSEVENGKVIYKGLIEVNQNGTTRTETKDFRLRLWIDESYNEQTSKTFAFDIYLYAKNVDSEYVLPLGSNLIRKAIEEKENTSCGRISWEDSEDNITYLSGTNDCIDMNYVWYSGKLWQITAIYSDGSMKLMTHNNITSISFNIIDNNKFYTNSTTKSYMYQWLNEDFYDSLYYPDNFIDTSKQWNATKTTASKNKPANTTIVSANVGLVNAFEYYNSYRCINDSTNCEGNSKNNGYMNSNYFEWLLNPSSDVYNWMVNLTAACSTNSTGGAIGVRPAIIIKPNVEFTGEGTVSNPYKIVGDKQVGKTNEKINTRLSGEYVKLKNGNNEQLFRIIDIEDNKTKIIAMDYADGGNTRSFSTTNGDILWGTATTTDPNTWYTYLNNTYYPNLVTKYGNIFDSGVYYLGISGINYKLSICADYTGATTKECEKTTAKGTYNIGLSRYGELFATQQAGGYETSVDMWFINRVSNSVAWNMSTANGAADGTSTLAKGVRPTVHLKSTVKILSGTGTESDPYVVGL